MCLLLETLKPGGWLQVQEMDLSDDLEPQAQSMNDLHTIMAGVFDKNGLGASCTRQLGSAMKKAGLQDVVVESHRVPVGKLMAELMGNDDDATSSLIPFELTVPKLVRAASRKFYFSPSPEGFGAEGCSAQPQLTHTLQQTCSSISRRLLLTTWRSDFIEKCWQVEVTLPASLLMGVEANESRKRNTTNDVVGWLSLVCGWLPRRRSGFAVIVVAQLGNIPIKFTKGGGGVIVTWFKHLVQRLCSESLFRGLLNRPRSDVLLEHK